MQNISKYIGFVLVTLVALVLYRWTTPSNFKIDPQALEMLKQEVEILETEVAELESSTKAQQDDLTTEKVIRNQLFMQKENEIILEVPPELSVVQEPEIVTAQTTPWQEWKQLLWRQ